MKIYQEWLANPYFDEKTKEELRAMRTMKTKSRNVSYDLEFAPRDSAASSAPGSTV